MKKIFVIIFIFYSCFACSNKIDIHADLDYIPVVYCILDLNSEVQVVRVSRTYRSDTENSGKPPLADSLVISEPCEIYIEKWLGNEPVETYFFNKTKLTRDTGFFPVTGQESYVAIFQPEPLANYALYVYFPDLDKVVSGETLTTSFPMPEDPKPEIPREITITRERGYTARWYSVLYGGAYQGVFTLSYLENLGESTVFQQIQWSLPNVILDNPNELISQELNSNRFYELLVRNIPVNPEIERELVGLEFTLVSGGEEIGLSLRTSDIKDFSTSVDYTNLDNGIGLFSSKARINIKNLALSDLTEDAICSDPELKLLNFKKAGTHE